MAMPARDLSPYKRKLIKLIHVGKRSLALSDADYRAMLQAQTGRDSCSGMSMSQLEAVVEHLRRRGFDAPERPATPARAKRLADDPQSKLIRHLWLTLHAMGAIRDSSEAALASYVKRQTQVESLEWLNGYQASRVIEALKAWIRRVEGS